MVIHPDPEREGEGGIDRRVAAEIRARSKSVGCDDFRSFPVVIDR